MLVFSACKLQTTESIFQQLRIKKSPPAEQATKTVAPSLDTTIVLLPRSNRLNLPKKQITENEAEILLYQYFKRKGVLPQTELNHSQTGPDEKLIIRYDTIYKFRTKRLSGAVISYWLGPADLNGHCFQPSKAIILPVGGRYRVSYENFIPSNFAIDSSKGSSLYGYDYECGGRGVLKTFKITLQ
jgi:hypothetical protein